MSETYSDFTSCAPDFNTCRTERIVEDVSRCLSNNAACKYGLPAGYTTTYCLHHNHRDFRYAAFLRSHKDQPKAKPLKIS
jgi:hypothetical protein